MRLTGIHHITAIASDAQQNLSFYAGVLGLRLVKTTVNFDSPDMYHLYYGDYEGSPGSLLTFFVIPGSRNGHAGTGGFVSMSLSIGSSSFEFWANRLRSMDIPFEVNDSVEGIRKLVLSDPDGLRINLVVDDEDPRMGYETDNVPSGMAIKAVHSVQLLTSMHAETQELLEKHLGFKKTPDTNWYSVTGKHGDLLEVEAPEKAPNMKAGAGTIHHVALRVANEEDQTHFRELLLNEEYNVSPVMNRKYFKSIYFREPGGALFEIATDPPGMHVDEPVEKLGQTLVLPEWYESRREEIKKQLPEIDLAIQPYGIDA